MKCGFLLLGNKEIKGEMELFYIVDFKNVFVVGLEFLFVVEVFVGLCVNEVCYLMNKYKYEFMVVLVSEFCEIFEYVN